METVFDYKDLSDFVSRTKVIESMPEGRAVIVIGYIDDIPFPLPGFSSDLSKLDFQIQEEGYNYWLKLDGHIMANKQERSLATPFYNDLDILWPRQQHLTPSDCFKLRECPECKQITAQEQRYYNPDDPGQGMVWHCTKCKENIDLV